MRTIIMNLDWNKTFQKILKSNKIALATHVHPDGDAYGSLLGMWHLLKNNGSNVTAFVDHTNHNGKYSFLPGYSELIEISQDNHEMYDLAVTLDCGDKGRVTGSEWLFSHSRQVINIDHHYSNPMFGHENIVDDRISSTCELLWKLSVDSKINISKEAATCLFTGIMTDTGNFLYENTSPETYRSTADLVEKGADSETVKFHLYHNKPLANIQFLGFLIQQMQVLLDGKVIILNISREILDNYGVSYEDLDEFVAFARDIKGVEVSALLKEMKDGNIKISLRSKSYFDVSELAQQFNGGGHQRAAGAVSPVDMEKTREQLKNLLEIYFQEKYYDNWNT
ncbi:MAG: bifunctional oligoribonuclease/PAP phosphatase NrnA [Tindallia sp. MSAO_Bac2]|nr:MAG: bifunctional oligoribonuclease/PAP phosphatase NrnA [Tindallia sp. MSAO_Bac2]